MPTRRNRRPTLYGYPSPQPGLQQEPIVMERAPTAADTAEIGCIWVDRNAQTFYILTDVTAGVSTWSATTGGAIAVASMTVNPGNITVTAGDIDVTAGDLNVLAGTGTIGTLVAGATQITSTLDVTTNATIGGTLDVTGDVTLLANLAVTGDVTVTGDFDITSANDLSFTTTSDTDPAISFTTNGGTNETIQLINTQGTAADAIDLNAMAGGVTITGDNGAITALTMTTGAASGINQTFGTAGMITAALTNGNYALTTGTGTLNISNDAAATTINVGTGAAVVKTINIGGTGANVIAIGNTQTAGSVAIGTAMTGGTISIGGTGAQTGAVSIAPGTGVQTVSIATGGTGAKTVNIGTGAIDNVITIGTATGAASLALVSGTGNLVASSTGTVLIDSAGVLELNSSAGVIGIGNDAVNQNINIGTGGARTVTIGNTTGATAVTVAVGTGTCSLGTSATAHITAVGSNTAGSTLILNTPANVYVDAAEGVSITSAGRGISLPGNVLVLSGAGSPDTVINAAAGSLYLRTDPAGATSRAYINTDGATAWTNITCAA